MRTQMIGSRGKVASVFNAMIKEGYREEELEKVYSPIGLKIGAQTPEEIAVSIFAEIIEVKNKKMACNIEDSIIDKLDSSSEKELEDIISEIKILVANSDLPAIENNNKCKK